MGWASQGEEICGALLSYNTHLSLEKKAELKSIYGKAINLFQGEWIAMNQVTFVNLRNREEYVASFVHF